MATAIDQLDAENSKTPRTERGQQTMRKLLDAAALEFGEKGFHETSIAGITNRAGTALGSFYTYFGSKDELFRALVKDMSVRVKEISASAMTEWESAIERERSALAAFMIFAREHKEIYRIVDESEFVDPESHRLHYEGTAARIFSRLQEGQAAGDLRSDLEEGHAWAIMGMNVFLGMRYGYWSEEKSVSEVADIASGILEHGIAKRSPQ